jgi:hypothetical protein
LSEAPLAKVANLYNCPSCRRATFSDDANETQTFSGADENPWDGYNFALDDESASEEDPTSKDEAGARTGEKAKDVARSLIGASFYHPDIDAHEQQLRADTVVDGTDHTPSCSTPAVARTAANAGQPPFKLQADSTAALTGQDEEKKCLGVGLFAWLMGGGDFGVIHRGPINGGYGDSGQYWQRYLDGGLV